MVCLGRPTILFSMLEGLFVFEGHSRRRHHSFRSDKMKRVEPTEIPPGPMRIEPTRFERFMDGVVIITFVIVVLFGVVIFIRLFSE